MNNDKQIFLDAIAQLQQDQRFLEKKKKLALSDKRKPKMTMIDHHYLQLIPSLVENFEMIVEEIEDGNEIFETDIMIAEAVNKMNNKKQDSE